MEKTLSPTGSKFIPRIFGLLFLLLVFGGSIFICIPRGPGIITGVWLGNLEPGENKRVILEIIQNPGYPIQATIASPDEDLSGLGSNTVTFSSGMLHLAALGGDVAFDGKLNRDNNSLEGTWSRKIQVPATSKNSNLDDSSNWKDEWVSGLVSFKRIKPSDAPTVVPTPQPKLIDGKGYEGVILNDESWYLKDSFVPGQKPHMSWLPSLNDVQLLEKGLANYIGSQHKKVHGGKFPVPLTKYVRQYSGSIELGHHVIHVYLICDPQNAHDWKKTRYDIQGEGNCEIELNFDVQTRKYFGYSENQNYEG